MKACSPGVDVEVGSTSELIRIGTKKLVRQGLNFVEFHAKYTLSLRFGLRLALNYTKLKRETASALGPFELGPFLDPAGFTSRSFTIWCSIGQLIF